MAIKRNRRFHPEIPTASLSDIMFFLFLFFLIISTLANPNVIKLTLPKAKSNETTNKDHITLSVTEDQRYFVDKTEVSFSELENKLLEQTTLKGDKVVVVRLPADNKVQDLVDVMQIGVKLKLNFVIATAK
ncbi:MULTISPECIES: ExbD/TolR family protein [Flavobacterium]|uniref:Biopolymer transporter ExbD n=1 Tax=Flavobacterium aurantiibacter TaxID=2023067 RepID=A0A255ZKZ8_9FLAO|nr:MULTISPECIES: biopolymer transporter ExbD [Flavobacterium]OYQ42237.1 biopolymer transporter ExbD [Flavobacterium aurantiibacter]